MTTIRIAVYNNNKEIPDELDQGCFCQNNAGTCDGSCVSVIRWKGRDKQKAESEKRDALWHLRHAMPSASARRQGAPDYNHFSSRRAYNNRAELIHNNSKKPKSAWRLIKTIDMFFIAKYLLAVVQYPDLHNLLVFSRKSKQTQWKLSVKRTTSD